MDLAADVHGIARALGHHHHIMGGPGQAGPANLLHNIVLKIELPLGDQHGGSAHGDAHIQRQETGAPAHHLHDGAALVGLHSVPQLVDALNGGVAGSVEADGVVGAADIVVDGGGDTGHLELIAHFRSPAGEVQRTPEGAVAADGYNRIQAQQFAGSQGLVLTGHVAEFVAAGRVQERTALVDDMADTGSVHADKIAADKAVPPSADTDAVNAPA